jgi:hypothetical protein
VLVDVATHPVIHLAGFAVAHGREPAATRWQEEVAAAVENLDPDPASRGIVRYNLACHYALTGKSAKAIELLRTALAMNPGLTDWSKQDTDLASLRKLPEYEAIYK